jgi:hypothetical protein
MGIIAQVALGMAAGLLANMLLPAKNTGAYFHPPGSPPSPAQAVTTVRSGS